MMKATFAGGCFWCMEAVFQRLHGVKTVVSGYAGGTKSNPTYEEVCNGTTGHLEAIQVTFDPKKITYEELLDAFWKSHDPTSVERQGPDEGEQYGAAVFYHNGTQKKIAEKSKAKVEKELGETVVTEIKPFTKFYKAEDYHQNYYNNNQNAPYCRLVIQPKLQKLKLE